MSKKSIALLLSAVLAIGTVAFGSVAFLTSRDTVTNVFTVGKVSIKVDETKVNEDGKPVDAQGVPTDDPAAQLRADDQNDYKLIPGSTYTKDPMLTVRKDSEECYVRMMVTLNGWTAVKAAFGDDFVLEDLVDAIDSKWILEGSGVEDTTNDTITYEYRYSETVEGGTEDIALEPLFNSITIPGETTGVEMQALLEAGFQMTVEGHAIQTANLADEDTAWTAFDGQYGA